MNITFNKINYICAVLFAFSLLKSVSGTAKEIDSTGLLDTIVNTEDSNNHHNVYVANNDNVRQVFFNIGELLHRPFIISAEAEKKRITGNFSLNNPKGLLNTLSSQLGLVWYDDGSSIYVYSNDEIESNVVRLAYAPFVRMLTYLQSSGLYDERFPIRSDGKSGSFYVSGPPVYVELVKAAAKYIDSTYAQPGAGTNTIRVIKLKNTFVNDRIYTQRDAPIKIPGVATVLNQLLNGGGNIRNSPVLTGAKITIDSETRNALDRAADSQKGIFPGLPTFGKESNSEYERDKNMGAPETRVINIVAYSDTNSLLIQGSERQVSFVEELVNSIDIPKQQIQLSLWIIDISKDDVNELGVRWKGVGSIGNIGMSFNNISLTPEGSINFLADVSALAEKGDAQVVSRPEILTQENVPALFDNNSSFYAKLIGERTTSLEKITYGTMISVLPRLSQHQREIEMILNIQDGGLPLNINGLSEKVDDLPVVHNTQISTEARVPVGYSLLVGGYSRDQDDNHDIGVPLLRDIPFLGRLFDYSYVSHKKMIRIFLIHPKLLKSGETWQGNEDRDLVTLKSTVSMLRKTMINN